uniref:Uncharacterized protein n=1 Tax=Cannabis sativa TaxID=3483 RepID=A0A803R4V1_CANSA
MIFSQSFTRLSPTPSSINRFLSFSVDTERSLGTMERLSLSTVLMGNELRVLENKASIQASLSLFESVLK